MDLRTWTESSKGDKKRGGEGGQGIPKTIPPFGSCTQGSWGIYTLIGQKWGLQVTRNLFLFRGRKIPTYRCCLQNLTTNPPLMHDLIVTMKPNNILVGKLKHVVRFPTSWWFSHTCSGLNHTYSEIFIIKYNYMLE